MSEDLNRQASNVILPSRDPKQPHTTVGAWIGKYAIYASLPEEAVVIAHTDTRPSNTQGHPLAMYVSKDGLIHLQYRDDKDVIQRAEVSEAAFVHALSDMLDGLKSKVKEVQQVAKLVVE
jgi:hypothetical protein